MSLTVPIKCEVDSGLWAHRASFGVISKSVRTKYFLTSQLPVVSSATKRNEFCCEENEMWANTEFER